MMHTQGVSAARAPSMQVLCEVPSLSTAWRMEGGREEWKGGRTEGGRRKERRRKKEGEGYSSFLHGNENPIMSLSYLQ